MTRVSGHAMHHMQFHQSCGRTHYHHFHCYSHFTSGASSHIESSTARDIEWIGAAFSVLQRGIGTASVLEQNTEWRVVLGRVTAIRSERVPLSGKYIMAM